MSIMINDKKLVLEILNSEKEKLNVEYLGKESRYYTWSVYKSRKQPNQPCRLVGSFSSIKEAKESINYNFKDYVVVQDKHGNGTFRNSNGSLQFK